MKANPNDVASLPPVLDVPTVGRLLGLGRSAAYDLVLAGRWPTPVLRLGRRLRIPTAPLLALLGLNPVRPSQSGGMVSGSPTAPAVSEGGRP
jgi:predicted DNA-binding transcriptional regulator AlpA